MTLTRQSGTYESPDGRHSNRLRYLHGACVCSGVSGRDIKRQISDTDQYTGDAERLAAS